MLSRFTLASQQAVRQSSRVAHNLVRGYATERDVKVPLELYGLQGTYATALFTAASKEKSLPQIAEAITKLQSLLSSDKKAKLILTDPSLSRDDQRSVIKVITESVGGNKIFSSFLETLGTNNRLAIIDEVIADFLKLQNANSGLVEATVTSAKPLDNTVMKKLSTAISGSKFVGSGKELKLTNVVDKSIKGGLVVSLGDRTVDLSVSSKLNKYNQLLSEAI